MTKFGDELIDALKDVLAFARGEAVPGMRVHRVVVIRPPDIAAIRERLGPTHEAFAARFGLDPGAIRDWEEGRRAPDRAARVLLLTIDRHPEAVEDALRGASATTEACQHMPKEGADTMQRIALDAEAGQVSAELARRGIPADARVHVVVEVVEEKKLPVAALAQAGGAFDCLAEEPDLYTDADLVQRAE